jgi:hypothetical protein
LFGGSIAQLLSKSGVAEARYELGCRDVKFYVSPKIFTTTHNCFHTAVSNAKSYFCLGENECDRGNLEAAEHFSKQALVIAQKLGMIDLVGEVNYDLARLERKRSNTKLVYYPTNCEQAVDN